jgi:hypothetical protein
MISIFLRRFLRHLRRSLELLGVRSILVTRDIPEALQISLISWISFSLTPKGEDIPTALYPRSADYSIISFV